MKTPDIRENNVWYYAQPLWLGNLLKGGLKYLLILFLKFIM